VRLKISISGAKFSIPIVPLMGCLVIISPRLGSQVLQFKDSVVVTASRLRTVSLPEARETTVVGAGEILTLGAGSAADALCRSGGADLRPRGEAGVQADFGLRGSGFEQVLVLVDGVRMNDPQTGHHNSDLPVAADDIERIEILHGPGSALWGPEAIGGVVHVITRSALRNRGSFRVRTGSHGTVYGSASRSFGNGKLGTRFSASGHRSAGFREDTDFRVWEFSHRSSAAFRRGYADLSAGITEKQFGANGFYAAYPSSERTAAALASLRAGWQAGPSLSVSGLAYARRHGDTFRLDYRRPQAFVNTHRSVSAGFEAHANRRFAASAEAVLGVEAEAQRLESSNLGTRSRSRSAGFTEFAVSLSAKTRIHAGLRADAWEWEKAQINPSLGLVRILSSSVRWKAWAGRGFRMPTFTELYYQSPANMGNPDLRPERAWCVETGLSWQASGKKAEAVVFYRNEQDRIDWMAASKSDPWRAVNIGKTRAAGVSANASADVRGGFRVRGSYTGIAWNALPQEAAVSKYGVHSLRHLVFVSASGEIVDGLELGLFSVYKKRAGAQPAVFLDCSVSMGIRGAKVSVHMENLLDEHFEDLPGVPSPGRALFAGYAWNWAG
jgi:iron complex outermembrane receptor protein